MKKINDLDFNDLYEQYFHHIYRFAYSLMGHPEEAGDITQETFIKLYRRIEAGEEIRTPKAWIYRVASNSCYNLLKRKKMFRDILEKENPRTDASP
ncbi:MAG: RNA polymerase sigma factor, partial [bacterium]|nr:RNA polymerase sigma factor [bacterium]